jgi:hypothetical protein
VGHPEDTFKAEDLDWIKSLRLSGSLPADVAKSMTDRATTQPSKIDFVDNPPNFYREDLDKKAARFAKVLESR